MKIATLAPTPSASIDDDGAGREPLAAERADAVAQILQQRFEPGHHAHLPHVFRDPRDVAESPSRVGFGLRAAHPVAQVLLDAQRQVELQLRLELALDVFRSKEVQEAADG